MTSFLERMASSSRDRVSRARRHEADAALFQRALASAEPLPLALDRFDLIAELKLRSPAAGGLAGSDFEPRRQLDAYAAGGAAAVSVLTEPIEFQGTLEHLRVAAAQLRPLGRPVMRKDFLVDAYQVLEARANGASGVLLIAAILSNAELDELLTAAVELGLFVLLEAFDAGDLERLSRLSLPTAGPQIFVGVNSRNLRTLEVDFGRFAELAGRLRIDVPAVAESGIGRAHDVETVAGLGYRLALVGSALMRDGDPGKTIAEFLAAGRRGVAEDRACL